MITALLVGIIVFLLAFIGWREYCFFCRERQHDAERQDLYNRIMARDLNNYNAEKEPRPLPQSRNFVLAGIRRSNNELGRNYQESGD